jgi:hypothetical protein
MTQLDATGADEYAVWPFDEGAGFSLCPAAEAAGVVAFGPAGSATLRRKLAFGHLDILV